ncbi:MAG: hypothetical protein A2983_01385 [Candidatus Magasanikbacteria bacterium RIFCSPLOWO2_01_FULL_40_15]|uniref:PEP-utilising enzyme mobile domain-containing protein n=1 Tax=Candidatus Magasanikbacteria bacterium RIFCSPLOWO2_01_FULL_40_15 TaxID=1798686 RepID=A0A1F6N0P5_9BACT|nr:MAG: hypothetical protein A2983_01385 [Candidatus Magasanikbacteria bacterium RIFCSPLOWO2_01_FULL_40_15]
MITQAMLCQVTKDFDKNGNIIDSGIPETIFTSVDGVFEHYMPNDSIQRLEQNGEKNLDSDFVEMLNKKIEDQHKNFYQFCESISKQSLANLSNSELLLRIEDYQNYLNRTLTFFELSTPAGTASLVHSIKNILNVYVESDKVDDYFLALSTPGEKDSTMEERIDQWLHIQNNSITESDLLHHAWKYPALFFNTYDVTTVIHFLNDRIKIERQRDIMAEIAKIEKHLSKIKTEHEKIYVEIHDRRLRQYSITLQRYALLRYRLKHLWSGAEYLCLGLMQETQKRIDGNFEDFIKTYSFSDIAKFLETGESLDTQQISNRLKRTVIHYREGTCNYYYGDDGEKFLISRGIHKEGHQVSLGTQKIKGNIANKGLITARARIINVEDLEQFMKDSQLFQKGEILVTTMTSPIMVSLIEKAAGIITDEGGITSHAAVVSREFGIPCLVGTRRASKIIKTGDEIELDANTGCIKILSTHN